MSDFLQHWRLNTKPFEATWDTRFYYRSPQHQEALDRLLYLASEKTMNLGMLHLQVRTLEMQKAARAALKPKE